LGIIAVITGAVNARYVDMAAGIYTLILSVLIYIWGVVRTFNAALVCNILAFGCDRYINNMIGFVFFNILILYYTLIVFLERRR